MAAPTVVRNGLFSVGNMRQVNLDVTLGAASSSGVVDTGLAKILHVLACPVSLTTALITIAPNLGSQATAINGRLSINSGAAGDRWFITCYGK